QIQGVDWAGAGPGAVKIFVSVCNIDLSTCSQSAPYTGTSLSQIYPGGTCDLINNPGGCASPIHPTPNDAVKVTVVAQIQVVTPLVRPFFGCTDGSKPVCDVPITSTAVSRYEGDFI
ncbi:MAG TPA: hypothetical protein VF937_16855, partial [Chloroflexota bacterium]